MPTFTGTADARLAPFMATAGGIILSAAANETPGSRVVSLQSEQTRTIAYRFPNKRIGDLVDFAIDWSARLGTDAIESVKFKVPDNLTLNRTRVTASRSICWLSGGELGESGVIEATVSTVAGRTLTERVTIVVAEN